MNFSHSLCSELHLGTLLLLLAPVISLQIVDNSSFFIVVILVLSLYNQMASPVDVGDLPNHVKYCVSVLSLQRATIRTSLVGIPNIALSS